MNKALYILKILVLFSCIGFCCCVKLLAPVNTTISLFCDTLFASETKVAHWFKDGSRIGAVTDSSNLILNHSPELLDGLKDIPEIGYLIISGVKKDDRGKYWCESESGFGKRKTKTIHLQVAYIDHDIKLDAPSYVIPVHSNFSISCRAPTAFPPAAIYWIEDNLHEKVPSTGRIRATNDGRLHIDNVWHSDTLFSYACIAKNIAGSRKIGANIIVLPKNRAQLLKVSKPESYCRGSLLSFVLWYVAGLLTAGVLVLGYALIAVLYLKPNTRSVIQPSCGVRPPIRWSSDDNQGIPV